MENSQEYVSIYPAPPTLEEYDSKSIFKWSKADMTSEFSFSYTGCLPKTKEPSLPYCLRITGEVTFSSWIRTRVGDSISYDYKRYTKRTSLG